MARDDSIYVVFSQMKSDLIATIPSKKPSFKHRHRFLNSCIKIEEKRVSRQLSIPSQVYFYLDSDIVDRISKARAEQGSLYLEPQQLTNLRYYSLINSPVADRFGEVNSDRLSLVFTSNYLSQNSQKYTTVVRSTISFSGQIHQEVQQDLWQDFQLSSQVIQAHHWLTAEILRQLPLEKQNYNTLLLWILWLPIAIAFTVIVVLFLPLSGVFKIIVAIILSLVLKELIKRSMNNLIKPWIIRQLISGYLSNKNKKRQLGFKILSLLQLLINDN